MLKLYPFVVVERQHRTARTENNGGWLNDPIFLHTSQSEPFIVDLLSCYQTHVAYIMGQTRFGPIVYLL
jgi:hypothetical protein